LDRKNNRFSQVFFAAGGMGASAGQDGHHCTSFPTNTGSGSIEAFEAIAPLIVRRKEFLVNSGGIGKFRGGLGQEVEIEVTSSEALRLSLLSDRQKYPPRGLLGGGPGAPVRIVTQGGRKPHPKSRTTIDPGERLILSFAGGAGFGAPAERARSAILRDVKYGYVTVESVRRDYGIEI
jgi:N-methylhydantoinase B